MNILVEWIKVSLNISRTNSQINNKKKKFVNRARKVTFSYFCKIYQDLKKKKELEKYV